MDDDDAKKQAGPNLEQIDQLHNLQLCVHDQSRPFIDFSISSKSEQSEQVRNGDKHHVQHENHIYYTLYYTLLMSLNQVCSKNDKTAVHHSLGFVQLISELSWNTSYIIEK